MFYELYQKDVYFSISLKTTITTFVFYENLFFFGCIFTMVVVNFYIFSNGNRCHYLWLKVLLKLLIL